MKDLNTYGGYDKVNASNSEKMKPVKTIVYFTSEEEAKNYIKGNWNLFSTFKHTFKLNDSGEYYWYSTEVSDD